MRTLSLLLVFLFNSIFLFAQGGVVNLLAQSPDGKTVKLVWFFSAVPNDITGFDIKRRDGLGEWKKLNSEAILPGVSIKKDLSPAGVDNIEAGRMKAKLKELLKRGNMAEYSYTEFMTNWKNADSSVRAMMDFATLDFDVSLLCGFGYVDGTIAQKIDYQYGLFLQGTVTLLAQTSWNFGQIPDLNVITEITSRVMPEKKGIQLLWNANMAKFKSEYVAGFNVYKRGIRLNDEPISVADTIDPSQFSYIDKAGAVSVTDRYSISTVSLFGIEGIIKPYTFVPDEHPEEYKKTIVTDVKSLGFYFKDGMSLEWTFPEEYEKFIKGFYVQKDNMPKGYNNVSELLSPSTRSFIDNTGSQVNYYVGVRVCAVYKDRSLINGVEKLFSYFPILEPPRVKNTAVKIVTENKKRVYQISWDGPSNGDNATHKYKVYRYNELNHKFLLLEGNLSAKTTVFNYKETVDTVLSNKFYVTAVSQSGLESGPGEIVSASTAE